MGNNIKQSKIIVYIVNESLLSLILLYTVLSINNYAISQNFGGCGTLYQDTTQYTLQTDCNYSSAAWTNKYRTPGWWIPNDSTPIKTILVNWIICRDDNGNNGWQDTLAFHQQVGLMFSHMNEWYSNSQPKGYAMTCEPNYTHIYDTRIRFELNDIIFIDNSSFNVATSGDAIINYIHSYYPETKNVLNHIFTMPTDSTGIWGYYSPWGPNHTAYVHTYYSMFSDWYVVWEDHIYHIAHEYGHAVGLHHTYDSEQREIAHYDFLDDVFGLCPEPSCPCQQPPGEICYLDKKCFYIDPPNPPPYPLMSGHLKSRYISPKSAGRMHRALSIYDRIFRVDNRPMYKYVKEKYSFQVPLHISENETWDFAIKMYQDIVVDSGSTLTIMCKILMPIDGKIIVKPGAKLIVDGAQIECAHTGAMWQGIEVWGNKYASQHTPGAQGIVELKNGAVIENARQAIRAIKMNDDGTLDWDKTGGIVRANGAIFRNNIKGVWFGAYDNYHPVSGNPAPNLSYFKNCTFLC